MTSDQYAAVPGLPGAFVDGSWEVWGEPEENPRSLHLLTCADPRLNVASQADHLRQNLHGRLHRGSRFLRCHTSPVTASNAYALTDQACTSNPTNVGS